MLIPPSKRKSSRIPLISLIDMTFMLFIFFILITRFTNFDQVELNIAQPKIGTAPDAATPNLLYFTLGADSVQLGNEQIAYDDIKKKVKQYLPGRAVIIEASEGSNIQQMTLVLDAVKLAGATDITLKEAQ